MKLLLAIGALAASASLAEACISPGGASFDFAPPGFLRYGGEEKVGYFIGRVLEFQKDPPHAVMQVLRDYSAKSGLKRQLQLPDVAAMKIKPFGPYLSPDLLKDQGGLFGYHEKDGKLWLVWAKGVLY